MSVKLAGRALSTKAIKQAPSSITPLISITNATFYRQQPSAITGRGNDGSNPRLFPDLTFELPSKVAASGSPNLWAIIGQSSDARTTLLQILRGRYLCFPPTARTYPYLSSETLAHKDSSFRSPSKAIQYVGFDAERSNNGLQGAYMSARYESRREVTDFSLLDYLSGHTELNADEDLSRFVDLKLVEDIASKLKLLNLLEMPVTLLSNGQTRRSRIAKALLESPELLLLDGPFMGLDPPTVELLSEMLHGLASRAAPRLILSLNPGEFLPDWISHLAVTDPKYKMIEMGDRQYVVDSLMYRSQIAAKTLSDAGSDSQGTVAYLDLAHKLAPVNENMRAWQEKRYRQDRHFIESADFNDPVLKSLRGLKVSSDGYLIVDPPGSQEQPGEPVVEMDGVRIAYGDRIVLGGWKETPDAPVTDMDWTVRQGERWGLFGQNGSGKTTLLALITSDHPQAYSQPIKIFGRHRLPEPGQPGISVFDIQARIGHSSPEVHAFFPKYLSVRRVIESAWADTPVIRPTLTTEIDEKVNAVLRWFQGELCPTLGPRPWMIAEMKRPPYHERHWGRPAEELEQGSWAANVNKRPGLLSLPYIEKIHDADAVKEDLGWADELKFGEMNHSAQRVALFLRAIIKGPELIVLDEAFSGMDVTARDKCHAFLSHGESKLLRYMDRGAVPALSREGPTVIESDLSRLGRVKVRGLQKEQALICISHKKEEIPGCVREWICLPEPGDGAARTGRLAGPLQLSPFGWDVIWGKKESEDLQLRKRSEPTEKDLAERAHTRKQTRDFMTEHSIANNSFAAAVGVAPYSLLSFLRGSTGYAAYSACRAIFCMEDPLDWYLKRIGANTNLKPVVELRQRLEAMVAQDPSLRKTLARRIGVSGSALRSFMNNVGGGWQEVHEKVDEFVDRLDAENARET